MITSLSPVKFKLLRQFYGVEEHIDYAVPLVEQIDSLSATKNEFTLNRVLLDLDIWYSRFYDRNDEYLWNPFDEAFTAFEKRGDFVIAQYLPVKQYTDKAILAFIQAAR